MNAERLSELAEGEGETGRLDNEEVRKGTALRGRRWRSRTKTERGRRRAEGGCFRARRQKHEWRKTSKPPVLVLMSTEGLTLY